MELSVLVKELNNKMPLGYHAKVGGSVILNVMGFISRTPKDVDIIISHNNFYINCDESYKELEKIRSGIKELFPLDEVHQIPFNTYCGEELESDKEKYAFNLKIHELNLWAFGNKVKTLNILVQKDFVAEDYYSSLKLNNIPCVPVRSILDAKKSYNRPKDLVDFHEMQKLMFF
jgi:hypothetical protein